MMMLSERKDDTAQVSGSDFNSFLIVEGMAQSRGERWGQTVCGAAT